MSRSTFNWRTGEEVSRRIIAEDDGLYTRSDMIFVYGCDGTQCRYVIPAGTYMGAKFDRARLVRGALKESKKCSAHETQLGYILALKADNKRVPVRSKAYFHALRLVRRRKKK